MTNEQAKHKIDLLDFYLQNYTNVSGEESHTAMMMAIKALEQQTCEDAVSRQAVDTLVDELARKISDERCCLSRGRSTATIMQDILDLPPVNPQPKWIPVKWHEITDEERKENDCPKEWVCYLDFIMPYDGQRILITTKSGYVELDECYSDDGQTFSLDSGYDWVDDVVAWMPLPQPYESQESEVSE